MKLAQILLATVIAASTLGAAPSFAEGKNKAPGAKTITIRRDGTVEGGTRPLREDEKAALCALVPEDYDFCPKPAPTPPGGGGKRVVTSPTPGAFKSAPAIARQ